MTGERANGTEFYRLRANLTFVLQRAKIGAAQRSVNQVNIETALQFL